jgi:hypothetical protein
VDETVRKTTALPEKNDFVAIVSDRGIIELETRSFSPFKAGTLKG